MPTVVCKGTVKRYSARLHAQKSEQAPEGAPDSEHDLSGAPPDCPVAHLSEAPTVGTQRAGDVAGAPDSVWWRTGLSGVSCDSNLHQTASLVVGAINTPTHPPFIASKFSAIKLHTRALDFIQRHNQRDQTLSQVRNHSKQISD